jgi:hypothetical protein
MDGCMYVWMYVWIAKAVYRLPFPLVHGETPALCCIYIICNTPCFIAYNQGKDDEAKLSDAIKNN